MHLTVSNEHIFWVTSRAAGVATLLPATTLLVYRHAIGGPKAVAR